MNKRKYKKTNSLWLKRFILRSKWGKFFLLASLFLLINFFIQVYRKPTEIISLIYEGQSSHLEKTWHRYKDVFQANSTENVKPETLASIAQVESAGRWAASPDWQFRWSNEKNKEIYGINYSEYGFGHNYILEAYICGTISTESGLIVDIRDFDEILKSVTQKLDHKFLNEDLEEFSNKVPTTENIALYCFHQLKEAFNKKSLALYKIRLTEGDQLFVEVFEGE